MTQPQVDRYVWTDLETFGLQPEFDPILEIGFIITDINLDIIDDFQRVVWSTDWYDQRFAELRARAADGDKSPSIVFEMHTKSGLFDDAMSEGLEPHDAAADALRWLRGHGVGKGDPLCGSTVGFDRSMLAMWMPDVDDQFSYRSIDVSSIKELCRRENPTVFAGVEFATDQKKLHRSLPDIKDTIGEYRYYRDNFLKVQR